MISSLPPGFAHSGRLTPVSYASTLGDYPRIFAIDPSGQFMAVGNQAADHVTIFKIQGDVTREMMIGEMMTGVMAVIVVR